jgi:16S rRNA processing protein RimM
MVVMASAGSWVVLAHLLRPQGRKGELLAELLTDFPERFSTQPRVYLAPPGFAGQPSEARETHVAAHWLPTGKNQGRVVLHFVGIDSINDAERLEGLDVILPENERPELDDDSSYVSDLVGCTVYDGPTPVGVIADVQFLTTPDGGRRLDEAPPLLSVDSPAGDEILIPFAKAFLVKVDVANKRVEMKLPPGLLEVNL